MVARARASVLRVVGLGPNGRPELGPVVSGEYLNERTNEDHFYTDEFIFNTSSNHQENC